MSPGSVGGTAAADAMPGLQRPFMKYIGVPLMTALGLMHDVETGAARYLDALTDERFRTGIFYGNPEDSLIGRAVIDQATLYPDLANETFQDNAYDAIHRFLQPT